MPSTAPDSNSKFPLYSPKPNADHALQLHNGFCSQRSRSPQWLGAGKRPEVNGEGQA